MTIIRHQDISAQADATLFIAPGVQHNFRSEGDEPARFSAVHATLEPKVHYPNRLPEPVVWS